MFKLMTFVLFFSSMNSNATGVLVRFHDLLDRQCPQVESSMTKKIFLTVAKKDNPTCRDVFSQTILNNCPNLSCAKLIKLGQEAFNASEGTVIGQH